MKRLTFLIATAAVTAAASSSPATAAEAEVLDEGIDNPAGLSGWDHLNHSVPPGADASGFDTLLTTIGDDAFPAEWRQWSNDLTVEGEGRFAFRYLGDPATLGYAGLDAVRVVTAVPEPAGVLVLASSLGVIGLMQRRERY
ncbi:choice-of-anchor J domain-containing protein [Massilia sp. CFBP9012]|uniref:choice-of-anchor J domain-containing protein n=1 Tax=Massilia sp. CFBP9012 TaxID=3096531 RepID=UPI002A6B6AF8|nr:choice-of-anchor J domain-containing protein [Massilia sp. CFBP9012]MDY0976930.1 choice-of-anchor J domain-containing protein [Massilia sp. CFBP9012]